MSDAYEQTFTLTIMWGEFDSESKTWSPNPLIWMSAQEQYDCNMKTDAEMMKQYISIFP